MAINFLDGISINGLPAQGSEATALTINSSNVVGTRELGSNAFNSTTIPTNNNQLTNGEGYTTNTGTTTASNSQTFTNKAGNISQWTNNSGYLTSLSGAVLTTGAQTIAGAKTFSNQLTINEPTANGGTLRVERKSGNANITPPSSEAFMIIDSNTNFAAINYYVNQDVLLAYGGGKVGIGTNNSPSHPLSVVSSYPQIKIQQNGQTPYFTFGSGSGFTVFDGIGTSNGLLDIRDDGTSRMRFDTAGNVGIGTTTPSQKLDVSGNINATGTIECTKFIANASTGFEFDIENSNQFNMRHTAANKSMFFVTAAGTGTINFGTNNVNSRVTITSTGALKSTVSLAVGSITPSTTTGRIDASNDVVAFSTSDIRLKNNIKSIDKALDKVNSIQGIEFDWIEKEKVHGNSGHDVGVIAQEIEEILPDVVTTRDNGYKAVKYEKIVPLLIEAIKDLSKQVDGLKRLI